MANSQGEQVVEPSRKSLYNHWFSLFLVPLGPYHFEVNTPNGAFPPDMAWPGDPICPAGLACVRNTCCLTHAHCCAQWKNYHANQPYKNCCYRSKQPTLRVMISLFLAAFGQNLNNNLILTPQISCRGWHYSQTCTKVA